jgi:uncharacterized membrane protein YhaH (DUF805 family)
MSDNYDENSTPVVQDVNPTVAPAPVFAGQVPSYVKPTAPKGKAWRDIKFGQAISRSFSNYANFKGRASVREFWFWELFSVIPGFVYIIIVFIAAGGFSAKSSVGSNSFQNELDYYNAPGYGPQDYSSAVSPTFIGIIGFLTVLIVIFYLAIIIPNLAIRVRRMHDINLSGAVVIFCIVFPIIGDAVIYYFCCKNEVNENNKYNVLS